MKQMKHHSINVRGLVQLMIDVEDTTDAIAEVRKELARWGGDKYLQSRLSNLIIDLEKD